MCGVTSSARCERERRRMEEEQARRSEEGGGRCSRKKQEPHTVIWGILHVLQPDCWRRVGLMVQEVMIHCRVLPDQHIVRGHQVFSQ